MNGKWHSVNDGCFPPLVKRESLTGLKGEMSERVIAIDSQGEYCVATYYVHEFWGPVWLDDGYLNERDVTYWSEFDLFEEDL